MGENTSPSGTTDDMTTADGVVGNDAPSDQTVMMLDDILAARPSESEPESAPEPVEQAESVIEEDEDDEAAEAVIEADLTDDEPAEAVIEADLTDDEPAEAVIEADLTDDEPAEAVIEADLTEDEPVEATIEPEPIEAVAEAEPIEAVTEADLTVADIEPAAEAEPVEAGTAEPAPEPMLETGPDGAPTLSKKAQKLARKAERRAAWEAANPEAAEAARLERVQRGEEPLPTSAAEVLAPLGVDAAVVENVVDAVAEEIENEPPAPVKPPEPEPSTGDFRSLGLDSTLVTVLDGLGYEEPTPIQEAAIPVLLTGRDVLGQAATGTGKTAAFALPLLHRLAQHGNKGTSPMALILVPTRELAIQVSQAIHSYGGAIGARVTPVYGGQPIGRQLGALSRGVDVVVATPGRAIDHLNRGSLRLDEVEVVVLDEADEMLDMGFQEDLETILGATPSDRQTMLFSATLPKRITGLAQRHLHDAERITVMSDAPTGGDEPRIREVVYVVSRHNKPAALARVLDVEAPEATIVFCRTRRDVDELTETMNGRGYRAEALHGGMTQEQRDRVMNRLRSGVAELLVATDVAARGLDIDTLTHVVNHSIPTAAESYVHRIGRVGRAGREGVAITLVEPREHRGLKNIERHTGRTMTVEKLPTIADLRARRLALLQAGLREELLADDLDAVRSVVESLSDEFDLVNIALAAVKMLRDETSSDEDDRDVPEASLGKGGGKDRGNDRGSKGGHDRGSSNDGPRLSSSDAARVWVSLGRNANIRPKDLVGAIANETSLKGRDIGAIEITDRASFVEVPSGKVSEVVDALSRTTIRGQKAHAAPDKFK